MNDSPADFPKCFYSFLLFFIFIYKLQHTKIKLVIDKHIADKENQKLSIFIAKCNISKTIAQTKNNVETINKPTLIIPPNIMKILPLIKKLYLLQTIFH